MRYRVLEQGCWSLPPPWLSREGTGAALTQQELLVQPWAIEPGCKWERGALPLFLPHAGRGRPPPWAGGSRAPVCPGLLVLQTLPCHEQ